MVFIDYFGRNGLGEHEGDTIWKSLRLSGETVLRLLDGKT